MTLTADSRGQDRGGWDSGCGHDSRSRHRSAFTSSGIIHFAANRAVTTSNSTAMTTAHSAAVATSDSTAMTASNSTVTTSNPTVTASDSAVATSDVPQVIANVAG